MTVDIETGVVFFFVGAIGLDHLEVRIGKKSERKIILFGEFFVRDTVIGAHSEYDDVESAEFVGQISDRTGFRDTARCVVFGVKVEQDRLATVLRQIMLHTVLIHQRKVWRVLSWL